MLGEQVGVRGGDGFAQCGEEGCFEFGGELVGELHVGVLVDEDFELEVPPEIDDIVDVDADRVVEEELAVFFDCEPFGEWSLTETFLDLSVGVDVVLGDFCIDTVFAFVEDVLDGFG